MKNKYLLSLAVGIALLIATMAMSMIWNAIFPSLQTEYVDPAFRPWNDPLMSLFFLYPVVLGLFLSHVWFKSRSGWRSGLDFGLTMGLLMSVPMFLVNWSSFTFSLLMELSWALFGFVNVLLAGLLLEKLEG